MPRFGIEAQGRDRASSAAESRDEARRETQLLVERAQKGDHEAFAALMRLHQRRGVSGVANPIPPPPPGRGNPPQAFL